MGLSTPDHPAFYRTTVAYLDALGSSAASQDISLSTDFLGRLYKAYGRVEESLRADATLHGLEYQIFSDLVCLAAPRFSTEPLPMVVTCVAKVMAIFATAGVLLRGGIAIDSFFSQQRLVFGPAIVRAVQLEKATAVPRVALAQEAVVIAGLLAKNEERPSLPIVTDLADGTVFVHFVDRIIGQERRNYRDELDRLLHRTDLPADVHAKLDWLAAYYNWGTRSQNPLRTSHQGAFRHGVEIFEESDD